jgi:hypothetical protein
VLATTPVGQAVFHLLFGGTCRPWNLQTRAGQPGSTLRAPAKTCD